MAVCKAELCPHWAGDEGCPCALLGIQPCPCEGFDDNGAGEEIRVCECGHAEDEHGTAYPYPCAVETTTWAKDSAP